MNTGHAITNAWIDVVETPYGFGESYSHASGKQPVGRYLFADDYAAVARERDELREALREAATRIEATLASNTLISKYADAELAKIARRARAALGGDGE